MATIAVTAELELYFGQINADLLTADEERALSWRIIRDNDLQAREQMICSNLRLVIFIAKRFKNRGLPLADLIAEGNIGLMRAIERFDPEQGRLSTYATWWIKQAIGRALIVATQSICVSEYMIGLIARYKRASLEIRQDLGRDATLGELAERLGVTMGKLRTIRRAARAVKRASHSSSTTINDRQFHTLPDHQTPMPDEQMIHHQNLDSLRRLLPLIDSREARILSLRFGLDGAKPMTLRQIATELDLSSESIRQLQNQGLRTLNKQMNGSRPEAGLGMPGLGVAPARDFKIHARHSDTERRFSNRST